METLFTQALGLSAPWRVVSLDFRPAEGLIAFQTEFIKSLYYHLKY